VEGDQEMRKFILMVMIIASLQVCAFGANGDVVTMYANGNLIKLNEETGLAMRDTKGFIIVPLRRTVEAMGGSVKWDSELNAAVIERLNDEMVVTVGNDVVYKNGESYSMITEAQLVNGVLYIPAEPIVDLVGGSTYWELVKDPTNLCFEYDTYGLLAMEHEKSVVLGD